MLCKKCSTALRIKNSYYAISGGDSPDTETKLVSVNFGKTVRMRRPVGFIEEGGGIYE